MKCASKRHLDGQQIQCIRPSGHPGDRHTALLDLEIIHWTGLAPDNSSNPHQLVLDFE